MIEKVISPIHFFATLYVCLFVVYVSTPVPEIIIQYPTPKNAGKIVYKNEDDVCYKYKSKEVSCPVDKSRLKIVK